MFLLGAGFSKIISGGKTPLGIELFENLKDKLNPDILRKYNNANNDIECYLTFIDLDVLSNSNDREILLRERETIKNYIIDILSLNKVKPDDDTCIKSFARLLRLGDVIVSLNYDILLEHYLWKEKKFSPKNGYTNNISIHPAGLNALGDSIVKVIKPHGSMNFHEGKVLGEEDRTTINLEIVEGDFPGSRIGRLGYIEEYTIGKKVILPSYIKNEIYHLSVFRLCQMAYKEAAKSTSLVIIGCSLREADFFIWTLLSYMFEKMSKRIILVDCCAEELKDKIGGVLNIPRRALKDMVIPVKEKVKNNFGFLGGYLKKY